jgi:diamine N-acetyltransferase
MMTSLSPVISDDLKDLFALQVRDDQKTYVAPNSNTIAQFAYLSGGYVFSIRSSDKIVGLMGLIDCREHDELEEGDDPNAAFLMRMMVADTYQGQGIGKAAMQLALDWARARGNSCFQTSVVPENDSAMHFYEGLGLGKTGRIVDDEIELSMPL